MNSSSSGPVALTSPAGRAVLIAATLGSGMTLPDGTVVNVALKTIGQDMHADLAALQWITNGYLLTLASFILLGGSLGDRLGRRRVFVWGVIAFAVASIMCGLAWSPLVLVIARFAQGLGAALLTPGSLSMIQGALIPADRARAIGAWSGLGGIATAAGPFIGGLLIEHASWRWIFLVNAPLALLTLAFARRIPESRDPEASGDFDVLGAALTALALGGITYALIEWGSRPAIIAGLLGLVAGAAFLVVEDRRSHPFLPLGLFRSRQFDAANLMTFLVYAALSAIMFFLIFQLQTVAGWTPRAAGAASLPITICMLLLAARGGALGQRIGPRLPMTVGPLLMAVGALLLLRVDSSTTSFARYAVDALPGLTIFGLGLAGMVAPLTATVLAAAPDRNAGVASGVNNAVARAGSLLAVAALPVAVGLSGSDYADPTVFNGGYRQVLVICAGLLAAGGAISWLLIRNPVVDESAVAGTGDVGAGG